ncbi:hypothetical protein TYRP_006321 [Tyrophagus putrescentiae]|nr:hypothetical protein TYRP_006321 [Tyrophagus putrescentiae]
MLLGGGGQSSGSSIGGNGNGATTSTKQTSFQYVPSNLRNRSTEGDGPRASGRASKTAGMITNPAVSALQNATKELGKSSSRTTTSSSRTRRYD